MTTKVAILSSVGIVLGVIVLGLGLLAVFVDPATRSGMARAEMLGQGLAMLALLPLGAIWILWASRVRKEREQKQVDQSRR